MAMTIPTLNPMPAGYVVQAADMNAIAAACTFLMTKPITRVHDTAGSQAITTTYAAMTFGAADFDTDGMWSASTPTRLTVQTPGFYSIRYMIDAYESGTSVQISTYAQVTTGSNNPAGAGVTNTMWPGYAAGGVSGGRTCARSSGVIPWYMYALDYVSVYVRGQSTGATASTTIPSYLLLEYVST